MSIEQMRAKIAGCYGESWKFKVKQMPDKQVFAVYMRFKRDGVI